MPVIDKIKSLHNEMTGWRRHLHANPETAYEEIRTAELVADQLTSFGLDVHRGLAKTGVVGTLRSGRSSRKDGPSIGLRADIDALNMNEINDFAHRSRADGKMHACGHDGHTAMLLGAAKYLAESRQFEGAVHFIFQPAEENLAGARRMVAEGLFERFGAEAVFGMHNWPGLEVGKMATRVGAIMASADFFEATITGKGGHGAVPHMANDPVVIAAQVVQAWQHIVSRRTDPMEAAVVSVTQIHAGTTSNVIPESSFLSGTTRTFHPELQDIVEAEMRHLLEGVCTGFGASCSFEYHRDYPPTINTANETQLATEAAADVVGAANVDANVTPKMTAEDFAWMLREKPGCYVLIGNGLIGNGCGEGRHSLHNPRYDFNDDILPIGASYFARLVERLLVRGDS